jgi:RNA polymerase sigma-70 factor (ECF subfamily)
LQARVDDKGNIILLKYQDRSKWYKPLIERGTVYLELASEMGEASPYHLEAAIASLHAVAPSFERTDWKSIYHLYESLYQIQPVAIVALNKAIASAYAVSKESALEQLLKIKGLEGYYIYHTSIGELYYEMQNKAEAKKFYKAALHLTTSHQEQQLLKKKIESCEVV